MTKLNCPHCSAEYISGTKFCQSCGCKLEVEIIENPVCPHCHKTFPAGSKFCDADGSGLVSPQQMIPKCENCGTEYPAETKFCPLDGGRVITGISQPVYNQNRPYRGTPAIGKYFKASLGNRFLASLLDGVIAFGLAIPALIFYVLAFIELDSYRGGEPAPYFALAAFMYLIPLTYYMIKDGIGTGQSWGKKALGLMVVYLPDDTPCTYGQSFIRNIIMTLIGFVPLIGWLVEPIMVLATDDGRRLGDKAANTQVIEKADYSY